MNKKNPILKSYQRVEWDRQRHYKIDEARQYPSSTTILGIKVKPAIPPWASKMAAQYASFKNAELVSDFFTTAPKYRTKENLLKLLTGEEYIVDVKGAPWRKSEAAMDIGTLAHDMVSEFHKAEIDLREQHNEEFSASEASDWFKTKLSNLFGKKGDWFKTDKSGELSSKWKKDDDRRLTNCIKAFLEWRQEVGFVIVSTEFTVFTDKHKYAGTVDALGYVSGKLTLVDYKTSSGIWPEHDLQVASYLNALLWMIENKLAKFEDVPNEMMIVNFNKEGTLDHKWVKCYDEALAVFLGLKEAFIANQIWESVSKANKAKGNVIEK